MKRLSLLLLCALLALSTACSKGASAEDDAAPDTAQADAQADALDDSAPTEAVPEMAAEPEPEEPETNALPENVEVSSILELELAQPAEIKNGTLVMYFTDEELFYPSDSPCSIGLISSDMADSIACTLDMTTYPDMFSGDDYRGVAIIPSEPIPTGSYSFSVSFGSYLVNFDMTVE